jgi:hypothetical protein
MLLAVPIDVTSVSFAAAMARGVSPNIITVERLVN